MVLCVFVITVVSKTRVTKQNKRILKQISSSLRAQNYSVGEISEVIGLSERAAYRLLQNIVPGTINISVGVCPICYSGNVKTSRRTIECARCKACVSFPGAVWRNNGHVFQGAPNKIEQCSNNPDCSGISEQSMSAQDERTVGGVVCGCGERTQPDGCH